MTRPLAKYFAVIVRLAAFAKASASQHRNASAKPWRRRDRTIQYATAGVSSSDAGDYWMPAFAGMTRIGLRGHQ